VSFQLITDIRDGTSGAHRDESATLRLDGKDRRDR